MPAQHYTNTTFLDHSGEKTTFNLPNKAITVASLPGFLTQYGALKTALDDMTLGTLSEDQWVGDKTQISEARPTSKFAQREIKLELLMNDTAGNQEPFRRSFGTVDLDKLTFPVGAGDNVDITAGAEMQALVAAIEALGAHPDDAAADIVVLGAKFIGRNI